MTCHLLHYARLHDLFYVTLLHSFTNRHSFVHLLSRSLIDSFIHPFIPILVSQSVILLFGLKHEPPELIKLKRNFIDSRFKTCFKWNCWLWKTFSQLASYIIITCRLQIESVTSFVVISHCFDLFIMFQSFSRCLNFTVIFLTVTSEDV